MSRRSLAWGVAAVAALALVACLAAPALALRDSGTRSLVYDDFLSVEIPFESASAISLDISFEVVVSSGTPVDVYFMDEASYESYISPTHMGLSYYAAHSYLSTFHAIDTFAWFEKGTFYVVVQHHGESLDDASLVEYEVEWEESAIGTGLCYALGAIFAVIVIGAIVIAILKAKRPAPKVDRWGRRVAPTKPSPPATVQQAPAPAPQAQVVRQAPATDRTPSEQPHDVVPEQGAPAAPEEGALPEPVYAAPAAYKMDRPRPP